MPLGRLIQVLDLSGKVVMKKQVPFYVHVIRKLTTGQVVLGTESGLHLIYSLVEDTEPIRLCGG